MIVNVFYSSYFLFLFSLISVFFMRNVGQWFHTTFCGLAKVAIFTTNVDAENQTLINHKCVCGALNRHFCQTAVSGCGYCCFNKFFCFKKSINSFTIFSLLSIMSCSLKSVLVSAKSTNSEIIEPALCCPLSLVKPL